jgi:heme-degrading monooxygenase HmoA
MHLAQLNVGLGQATVDAPEMAAFVANLDRVNALADAAPGFVWRLQDETGNATSIRPYDDERMIVNLSVWESVEALWAFVYDSAHLEIMRRRREWFQRLPTAFVVLWWVPEGEIPTVEQAIARLEHLEANGPTPHAFTFKRRFAPASGARVVDARA